ncbi:MAG: hypothetical protein WCL10_10405 [Novosphingobium sp.]|uniref:hypothetical protein n=1 Tax=Novosphingobium sp. TaxID=1874826 RepID=UPI00301970A1
MGTEVEDTVLVIDPLPADDLAISVDPIEFHHIMVLDPLPVDEAVTDVPPDAQTFGGPADPAITDPAITDPAVTDPVVTDVATTDIVITDDVPVKDPQPDDGATTDVVKDDGGATDPGTDAGSAGSDDGIITITVFEGDTGQTDGGTTDGGTTDGGTTDGGTTDDGVGRPVDPEPNWRTLTGADGEDQPVIACDGYPIYLGDSTDSFPIYDKVPTGEETGPGDTVTGDVAISDEGTVIETLDPTDPLIYSTGVVQTLGRPADPLPYERTNSAPTAAPEPEIDRTPVNYAQADTFHTGLDLL